MRTAFLLVAATLPVAAEPVLYALAVLSNGYTVGSKLPESGLFRLDAAAVWRHAGYNLPISTMLAGDPSNSDSVLIAAGNGLIRAADRGAKWAILTGNDVTELRDVDIDSKSGIYFAHTRGIRVSRDGGATWIELGGSLKRRYSEAVRVAPDGAIVAGGEDGIWRSEDQGKTWKLAGAAGWQVMRIERSPSEPCQWLASTQGGGVFSSSDCGKTFENAGAAGVGRNVYSIAFDPGKSGRVAISGFGIGVMVSDDGGKTWSPKNAGLPERDVTAVIFDPSSAGRLYAAVHEVALYVSQDAGVTWTKAGLEGSRVTCLRFLPEAGR